MLSNKTLMEWSFSAHQWYEDVIHGKEGKNYIPVDGLKRSDIQYAYDVSTLMPILYTFAKYYDGMRQQPTFIEIGTNDGSTTMPLLKAAAEINGYLHSIDPYECPDAHRLVDQFGYRTNWTHHKTTSDQFFTQFNELIDFAFIDGDHRWPVVERDIRNCYQLLNPGCTIWISDVQYGDLTKMNTKYADYESEYDGPDYTPHISGSAVGTVLLHDKQCDNGIAKAVYKVLPTLERATAIVFPLTPNPSILIRKMMENESDPLRRK